MCERKKSVDLFAHQRLLARLPQAHLEYDYVTDKVYQLESGYAGEIKVDQILPEIKLPYDMKVMKDLSFEFIPHHFIQIDTLILTPKGIIVLEIKQYAAGQVEFDEAFGKTIRKTVDQQTKMFDCVVDQVDRIVQGLAIVLQELQIDLPITPIIVMANSQAIVTQRPKSMALKYAKQLPRFIRQLLASQQAQSPISVEIIAKKMLARSHRRKHVPLCQRYNIPFDDLRKGILCLQCNQPLSKKKGSTWKCERCGTFQKGAAEKSLVDWFYLVDDTITQRGAKFFLDVANRRSITYILKNSNAIKYGGKRDAYYKYHLSEQEST